MVLEILVAWTLYVKKNKLQSYYARADKLIVET